MEFGIVFIHSRNLSAEKKVFLWSQHINLTVSAMNKTVTLTFCVVGDELWASGSDCYKLRNHLVPQN